MKRFLLRHLGNMGDLVFIVPPVLAGLKEKYPGCHITFVTAWGYKDQRGRWGKRNQGGFSLHLMMTNPHIDQLVHWHDTKLSLNGQLCREDGRLYPTWSRSYYDQQTKSGYYDGVFELDFGLTVDDNPLQRLFAATGLPPHTPTTYRLYFTESDLVAAQAVMARAPRPRIVLLEGLAGHSTRGWDPGKIPALQQAIATIFGVPPLWFGQEFTSDYQGQPLSLRANIATLTCADVGIGVMSGPLHFAAAAGLPTLTLFGDQPLHRAAPAYFLNASLPPRRRHRTLLAPATMPFRFLKSPFLEPALTPTEKMGQRYHHWTRPGRQATKSCLAALNVNEIMLVLQDMLRS